MRITRVQTRDGHFFEHGFLDAFVDTCQLCRGDIALLGIEQLDLRPGVPGPWMVRVAHSDASLLDHLIPAENIANLTLG